MDLRCNSTLAAAYTSAAQRARVVSEDWGSRNLFCAACSSDALTTARANTRAFDFSCPDCRERYQLKSLSRWNGERILDSAYSVMMEAIRTDVTPNLLLLHYLPDWTIERLLLIPRFFFSASVIERRKPLRATARRAGWVGCNIRIGLIPSEGKIPIIQDGRCRTPAKVRLEFDKVSGLQQVPPNLRGWTLDVLRCVKRLPSSFELSDVYEFEDELSRLHPDNRHVRDKVRQQLQVLRDIGFLKFVSPGKYRAS